MMRACPARPCSCCCAYFRMLVSRKQRAFVASYLSSCMNSRCRPGRTHNLDDLASCGKTSRISKTIISAEGSCIRYISVHTAYEYAWLPVQNLRKRERRIHTHAHTQKKNCTNTSLNDFVVVFARESSSSFVKKG